MTTASDSISPFLWWGSDLLWLIAAIFLLVHIRGKTSIALLIFTSTAFLIGTLSLIETILSFFGRTEGLLEYGTWPCFIVFDVLWTSSISGAALCGALIAFRIGAIIRRNNELEALTASLSAHSIKRGQDGKTAE